MTVKNIRKISKIRSNIQSRNR